MRTALYAKSLFVGMKTLIDWGVYPLLQQHHLPRLDEIACLEKVVVDT